MAVTPRRGVIPDDIAAIAAPAMGIHKAAARRLAVPDLPTTVLTMTLTGLAAEIRDSNRPAVTRRLLALLAMPGGALLGAMLVIHVRPSAALEVATALVAAVLLAVLLAYRRHGAWRSA